MNKKRLENLADGIFAIVLTLIAIDIKPEAFEAVAKDITFQSFWDEISIFLSYILSFAVLYMYWRSHHFLVSIFAKNADSAFLNLNGLYFMVISLIPFSGRFLAEAPNSKTALITFGAHIILIGATLLAIRAYVKRSPSIKDNFRGKDNLHSLIRISSQPLFAVFGILGVFIHPSISWICFTIPIVFNLIPGSVNWIEDKFKVIQRLVI